MQGKNKPSQLVLEPRTFHPHCLFLEANPSYPILIPAVKSDLTFLGSSRHLSGDNDPCAHLVAQITSPLEHLRAVSLGQSPRIPEHLIYVPGNKSHSSSFHNLTQDEVKECPGMPGKGVWNCGTIGHRGIGVPKRLETVLQQIFPDHSH